jgi:cellulose synthase/poly-beta-1,6-N-acetylglucosamine synthase-like glycosyltransferase
MLTPDWHVALVVFTLVVIAFFVCWHGSQALLGCVSAHFVWRYRRTRTHRNVTLASRVAAPPLVSIVVPAYNEALTIVESVRALLALDYEPREIVVINDGSSDDTLAMLSGAFHLVAAPVAFARPLATAPIRGLYRSVDEPALVVIDKQNGGSKADALNAGINAASGALVLMVDADTVIDSAGLGRVILPFLDDPSTVAVGGNLAVANGCRINNGRIVSVALPRSWLARFQIVEYMRSFLLFRAASASVNALTIISGAFGLFRRDLMIAVNGYDRSAIGEDMDVTVRLQEYCRRQDQPFRIVFDPVPLCSTQVPEDLRSLRSQRIRWRIGLTQVLWRHRRMIGNPRLGLFGVVVLPYVAVFDGLGPLVEIAGYVLTTAAVLMGLLDWPHYRLLLLASLLFGVTASLAAVLLNDVIAGRYMTGRDLMLLIVIAIVENCGYRQLNSWWACVGTIRMLTRKQRWGAMKRRVFEGDETPV